MTGAQCTTCTSVIFAFYFSKTANPNPSPTGKKFGFVLFGTPEHTISEMSDRVSVAVLFLDRLNVITKRRPLPPFVS